MLRDRSRKSDVWATAIGNLTRGCGRQHEGESVGASPVPDVASVMLEGSGGKKEVRLAIQLIKNMAILAYVRPSED